MLTCVAELEYNVCSKTSNSNSMKTLEVKSRTLADRFRWAIYPDFWKDTWGKRPLLGYVVAEDEFSAEREAYFKGLLPANSTLKPQPINVGPTRYRSRAASKGDRV